MLFKFTSYTTKSNVKPAIVCLTIYSTGDLLAYASTNYCHEGSVFSHNKAVSCLPTCGSNFEAVLEHASSVGFYQILTVLFPVLDDTLITGHSGFRARTAGLTLGLSSWL